jgi:hypothetical protein
LREAARGLPAARQAMTARRRVVMSFMVTMMLRFWLLLEVLSGGVWKMKRLVFR